MSLLGIDVGTTGCKAAAFREDGKQIARAYREYPTIYPREGWAELDSRLVWKSVREVIGEIAAETKSDPINALCVGSMGEAATPVSKGREILGRCILSSDTRGCEYIEALEEKIGQEAFYRINPNILGPNYTLPKLLWLKEHEPRLFQRADKFLLWSGLAAFMLGCEPCTSYSLANRTLLFDIHKKDWSDELLDAASLTRDKLPPCRAEGELAGTVGSRIAGDLGLPRGVKVVVGGHDQGFNALGAGIARAGRAVDGIGTFECITPVYGHIPECAPMLRNGLNVEHHVLPGLYVSFLYNQGGSLVRWFRDTFAKAEKHREDIYRRLGDEMPAEPTDLFVLPYFEMTGPPGFVTDASGVIVGLKTSTTRGEIFKAIQESVTFYLAEGVRALREMGIDTSEFVATGGGATSDAWLQIKADIFGVPFVRPAITECGQLGAAMLAGVATGAFANTGEAIDRFVRRQRLFEPDPHRHAIYHERLAKYGELYPLMRPYLASMEAMKRVSKSERTGTLDQSERHKKPKTS